MIQEMDEKLRVTKKEIKEKVLYIYCQRIRSYITAVKNAIIYRQYTVI